MIGWFFQTAPLSWGVHSFLKYWGVLNEPWTVSFFWKNSFSFLFCLVNSWNFQIKPVCTRPVYFIITSEGVVAGSKTFQITPLFSNTLQVYLSSFCFEITRSHHFLFYFWNPNTSGVDVVLGLKKTHDLVLKLFSKILRSVHTHTLCKYCVVLKLKTVYFS